MTTSGKWSGSRKPDTIRAADLYQRLYTTITGNATTDKNKVLLFSDFSYYWIADRRSRTLKRLNGCMRPGIR